MKEKLILNSEIILDANRQVHSALAESGEYNKSPHFRQENQEKVQAILNKVNSNIINSNKKMLDLGCGTGFMIHLAIDLMDEIHGVDITETMMRQVNTSSGKVHLHNALAENTPFKDDSFSLVTAYSFLDHLEDYKSVLKEAYRVLTPNGVFYSDLNPNRHFSHLMQSLEGENKNTMPNIVSREIEGMLHNGEYYEEKFGIDKQTLENAEPQKSFDHGFNPDEMIKAANDIGFTEARYEYDWYLGQASVMHGQSVESSNIVEKYLRTALPSTRGLFKYIRLILTK